MKKDSKEYKEGLQYLTEKYPTIKEISKNKKFILGTIELVDVMIEAGKRDLECIPLDAYFNTPPNKPCQVENN